MRRIKEVKKRNIKYEARFTCFILLLRLLDSRLLYIPHLLLFNIFVHFSFCFVSLCFIFVLTLFRQLVSKLVSIYSHYCRCCCLQFTYSFASFLQFFCYCKEAHVVNQEKFVLNVTLFSLDCVRVYVVWLMCIIKSTCAFRHIFYHATNYGSDSRKDTF